MSRCFDPKHRSYSGDRTWDECQYKAQAVKSGSVPDRVNGKMIVGLAVDKYVSSALEGGTLTALTAWQESMNENAGRQVAPFAEEEALATVRSMCLLADVEIIPDLKPLIAAVQPEWHYMIEGEQYHAHPDFVLTDGSIIDLKTAYRKFDQGRVYTDTQLTTYAYASWKVHGVIPPTVALVGIISSRNGVSLDKQIGSRSEAQLAAYEQDARARIQSRRWAEKEGVYQRNGRVHPYACSGCPARVICPSWAGTELQEETVYG
jgi:hypothetical protein